MSVKQDSEIQREIQRAVLAANVGAAAARRRTAARSLRKFAVKVHSSSTV